MNIQQSGDPVIGIVGGMGPQAGILLCNYITSCTNACADQDHLSVILMSFPGHIVDRTAFLEGSIKKNPAYQIVKIIRQLEQAGAGIVGIACNTSHSKPIFDVITAELKAVGSAVLLLNMPGETCLYLKEKYPGVKRVGVMSTNGTYYSRVYENMLRALDYEVVLPDELFQNQVIHKMVYDMSIGIKANPDGCTEEAKMLGHRAMQFFRERQVDAIILGCTEFSLLFRETTIEGMHIIDSSKAFAEALVKEATYACNLYKNQIA